MHLVFFLLKAARKILRWLTNIYTCVRLSTFGRAFLVGRNYVVERFVYETVLASLQRLNLELLLFFFFHRLSERVELSHQVVGLLL